MFKTLILSSALLLGGAISSPVSAQKGKPNNAAAVKPEVKFLDNIEVEVAPMAPVENNAPVAIANVRDLAKTEAVPAFASNVQIENVSNVQLKYAILLNTEVEQIQNKRLFSNIDEWYGTRYQMGGTTKDGIDCSAFVQTLYSGSYGVSLPRTAREQYDFAAHIDPVELKEGDLVFFNTQGGVSHVGVYLQNNKFVHAATSGGVMVSDLQEAYWSKHFMGAGRINTVAADTTASVAKP